MVSAAERLAAVEARLDLADLAARWCHLIDARAFDEAAALCTDDGVLRTPDHEVAGPKAIAAFLRETLDRYASTYHYVHSHVVHRLDPLRAAATADAHAEHGEEETCVLAGIRYADSYRREAADAPWCFSLRTLQIRYFLPWSALADRYRQARRFPAEGPPAP